MNQISFANLDQWADIHRLRSGPPPRDLSSLFSWIHAIHVRGPYEAEITAGFDRVMRHHTGGNECWLGISGQSHLGKSK